MLGSYRRKFKKKNGGKCFHLPISLIFKYNSECRKKTKSSLEEVFTFNRLSTTVYGDAATQLFI